MLEILTCPSCQTQLKLPDDYAGKKLRCSRCHALLQPPDDHPSQHCRPRISKQFTVILLTVCGSLAVLVLLACFWYSPFESSPMERPLAGANESKPTSRPTLAADERADAHLRPESTPSHNEQQQSAALPPSIPISSATAEAHPKADPIGPDTDDRPTLSSTPKDSMVVPRMAVPATAPPTISPESRSREPMSEATKENEIQATHKGDELPETGGEQLPARPSWLLEESRMESVQVYQAKSGATAQLIDSVTHKVLITGGKSGREFKKRDARLGSEWLILHLELHQDLLRVLRDSNQFVLQDEGGTRLTARLSTLLCNGIFLKLGEPQDAFHEQQRFEVQDKRVESCDIKVVWEVPKNWEPRLLVIGQEHLPFDHARTPPAGSESR